jgi:hypothetical protein
MEQFKKNPKNSDILEDKKKIDSVEIFWEGLRQKYGKVLYEECEKKKIMYTCKK